MPRDTVLGPRDAVAMPRDPAAMPAGDPEHPLARAFASFTEAAGSLERTYGQLQGQVAHLREELEVTNRDLASSLDENHRIRERLRRILEGLPCGVLVLEKNAEARISILNPEAARLVGGSFEAADALPAALQSALDRARDTGEEPELQLSDKASADEALTEAPTEAPTNEKRADENPLWIAIRHAWLEQSPEHATSVFILRDISEAKKLERDREQLRRQQALVEMSALLAHEIRNPLGSLELFAGLLAEANLEAESQRWIEHVQAGLRTLSATVNNVLQLHNPSPPAIPVTVTDAGELLDWAHDFLLPLAKQARVEMQVINELHGITLAADRHRLEQVLLNLALNSFRFMPGGGRLSIRGAKLDCSGVEIVVRDTGPGILPDDLPRIFAAGFSTRPGSSGLGLAVCRRIVEEHGGTITGESRIGYGATFSVRLPSASAEQKRFVDGHDERSEAGV